MGKYIIFNHTCKIKNPQKWWLMCNYPVFTVVMEIYRYIERIKLFSLTPFFRITWSWNNIVQVNQSNTYTIIIIIIQDNNWVITTKKG